MASTGVNVKVLDSFPILISHDQFYLEMFTSCGYDLSAILSYCSLYKLTNEEIIGAIAILKLIHNKVV
jgi:hypothetical protein